ncbi:uncharacterized protein LOC100496185 isoform X17 [Xenopus tropicalis]|uniref:Uncharacterized protein LOC100496185 isoform X17 n=1 Tax=Xenopus tropicalis TaxID=8364 RepID=A0A8J0SCY4_XENTR|nr:uncharacterized protein LOC100496185 isoform X17 [Xenopus tropicalis]|eukprot:XP_012809089.1 PREDICTED: uncharacterized protein LOC100496185 isoform X1 [Xenopus tropicalis]
MAILSLDSPSSGDGVIVLESSWDMDLWSLSERGTDNTENAKDPTEEDEFGSGQPKEPMGSLQRWQDSSVRSILLTREVFNVEEHPLKEQGEINIENTTENEALTKECNDGGVNTIENTTENDDLIKKDDARAVEMKSLFDFPTLFELNFPTQFELSLQRLYERYFRTLYEHYFPTLFKSRLQRQDERCSFSTYYRIYRALSERHPLSDSNKTYTGWGVTFTYTGRDHIANYFNSSKGDKKIADLLSTDPKGEKSQMINRNNIKINKFSWNSQSEGDKKLADLLSTDPKGEKSQMIKRNNRKIDKFSWNSQSEGTNGIAHKLKGLFIFMRDITWFLCFLIASSHVVVADTAVTKELSVAVSSDIELCGLKCDKSGIYTLDRAVGVPILDYFCPEKSIHYHDFNRERLQVNISTGCCIIKNAMKSDTGDYDLIFQGTKKEVWVQKTSCLVMDPVSVSNITSNLDESGMKTILSVSYSGEEATVVWAWNGGALPERHQLSDSNKTLTVPSTDTGTFTALVSNPVSDEIIECVLPRPEEEEFLPELRERKVEIGLCAALSIITGVAVVALKGAARKKFEGLKCKAANENSATAESLVSQHSCAVSVDGPTKEKSDMFP